MLSSATSRPSPRRCAAALAAIAFISACLLYAPSWLAVAPVEADSPAITTGCRSTTATVVYSYRRHGRIIAHMRRAWSRGWPRVLVINRPGADRRRDAATRSIATRPGYERDEYPPAVLRRLNKADVELVPERQNARSGAILGNTLNGRARRDRGRPYCDGAHVRFRFTRTSIVSAPPSSRALGFDGRHRRATSSSRRGSCRRGTCEAPDRARAAGGRR